MQTRERAHCARSVFPFIKEEKKKKYYHVISALLITKPPFCINADLRGRSGFLEIVFVGECEVLVCL